MIDAFAKSVKLLKAVSLLSSSQGATIERLKKELCTSRRSVFRLLAFLDEMGFPIIDEQPVPRTEKIYRLVDSYVNKLPNITIPNLFFTESEKDLLFSMLDNMKELKKGESVSTKVLKTIRIKIQEMTKKE
jgi:predicted DNA-binding transcriptional regulator YafY